MAITNRLDGDNSHGCREEDDNYCEAHSIEGDTNSPFI